MRTLDQPYRRRAPRPQRLAPKPVRDIVGALCATAFVFGPILLLLLAARMLGAHQ